MMESAERGTLTGLSHSAIHAEVARLRAADSVLGDRRGMACRTCLRVSGHARTCPMAGREDLRSRESD